MKSFSKFLTEARQSQAVMQARRLGLTSDGHAGWYDRNGEFTAKTEGGKLKFYNQHQILRRQDPPQNRTFSNQQVVSTQTQPKISPTNYSQSSVENQSPEAKTLTVVFGRFNPPTKGHQNLFNKASKIAGESVFKIYPSRMVDPKKNPLDPDTKISIMRQMYPKYGEKIVNDENIMTIFDVLQKAEEDGFTSVNIVVGSDRQPEFEKLALQYNGNLYNFDEINVVAAGKQDADSDKKNNTGISSSQLRKAAAENDFQTFISGLPKSFESTHAKKLFKLLRSSMQIEEGWKLWEIAPKIDFNSLRDNYVNEKIYKVGQIVENLNTGLCGKIIRRGTNYLICVTEDNVMFKPWIKDVREWTDQCGVPSHQREVGTDEYRKYTMKMTNTNKIKNFNIKNFINKHKKRSF